MKQPLPPFDPPLIVPAELYNRRNWIGWRLTLKPGLIKPAKTPVCIPTGSAVDFLNPKNHVSYDEAVEAIGRLKLSGVGFAITEGCGIIGGDMDKCRNPSTSEIEPWALEAIKYGETWFEISPSGCGIRFFALAEDILPRAVVSNDAGVEIYPSGRYLTFTGDHLQGSPYEVRKATRTIVTLLERVDTVKAEKAVSEVPRASEEPSTAASAKVERLQHDDAYAKTPFGMINARAMANLKLWVPELFPTAEFQPGTKGYRIKSADLGRPELVEDLSIHPVKGITDWGVHDMGDPKQGRRSAIDLVIEWEPTCHGDRRKAAIWLGKRLGVSLNDEPRFTRIDEALKGSSALTLINAATIRPEAVDWLWEDWLQAGAINILAGQSTAGKSTIALKLAAIITTGGLWPDGTQARQGHVIFWSGEDGINDTLLPRFLASGGDPNFMHFVGGVERNGKKRAFEPARDMGELERAMQGLETVRMIVLDPVAVVVVGDSHKNTEARVGLQPFADLCLRAHACGLGVHHFTKNTTGGDPLDRISGSLAFHALPRCALVAARNRSTGDPDAPRALIRAKISNGPDCDGFEYRLERIALADYPEITAQRATWGDPVFGTARQILADFEPQKAKKATKVDEAVEFLEQALKDGPRAAGEIITEAIRMSVSERSLQRARQALGVLSEKKGFQGAWIWTLPEVAF